MNDALSPARRERIAEPLRRERIAEPLGRERIPRPQSSCSAEGWGGLVLPQVGSE